MKVYLKNGCTIKINQQIANEIADMKKEQSKHPDKASNILVHKPIGSNNLYSFFDIDEIIAIK